MAYDSTQDTMKHIKNIQKVMDGTIIPELQKRSKNHDKSKLESPEKETYDEFIPKLREEKYGTPEYLKLRAEMEKKGLKHHYESNRHHPEHFKDGINDMTLIDVLEMFSDWYAASLVSDTDFVDGLKMNKSRMNISDQLYIILMNTYNEYFKK